MVRDCVLRVIEAVKGQGYSTTVAKIIAAQAMHESAKFSSNLFLKNANAFGMKVPSVRKSPYILSAGISAPASEGSTPYANYRSLEDSVKDLIHWHSYVKSGLAGIITASQYAAVLKAKGFYGDTSTNYTTALNRHLSTITTNSWA